MPQFFAPDNPAGSMLLFGPAHLILLGCLGALIASLIIFRHSFPTEQRKNVRYVFAAFLAVNEIAYHVWLITTGQWDIQWHLPLHLCSLFVVLSIIMLVTKSYPLFELTYFLGIGGAIQPLLTSEVGVYGFPHFYAFQIFISHGGIILAAVYMAVVEGMRPSWSSIKRVFIWGNIYMLFVTIVNFLLGSNYMYTMRKPHIPTILDHLGPWPWYILSMEAIALFISIILFLPLLSKNHRI